MILGEQDPIKDKTLVQAKCSECIATEEAISFKILQETIKLRDGQGIEVKLEDGSKGLIIASVKGIEDLGLSEIIVAGRKINCPTVDRLEFQKYLESLPDGDVEVIYHFSLSIAMPPTAKRRKKNQPPDEEEGIPINRYCVAKLTKERVLALFDKIAEKTKGLLDALSRILLKEWILEWSKQRT